MEPALPKPGSNDEAEAAALLGHLEWRPESAGETRNKPGLAIRFAFGTLVQAPSRIHVCAGQDAGFEVLN